MYWLLLSAVTLFVFAPLCIHQGTSYYVHYKQCHSEFEKKQFLAASPQCKNKWTMESLGPDQAEACAKAEEALWVWPSVCAGSRMWKHNAFKVVWELLTDSYWKLLPLLVTAMVVMYWHFAKQGDRRFFKEIMQHQQPLMIEQRRQEAPRRRPAIHFIEEYE